MKNGKAEKTEASVISIASYQDAPDYYEVLQVASDASHAEIISAYRQAKETYKQNSLSTYSLFDDEETEQAIAQIEEAYQVLAFPGKRRLYDQTRRTNQQKKARGKRSGNRGKKKAKLAAGGHPKESKEFEQLIAGTRVFSGAVMRALRKYRGISMDEIADRTKISKTYLKAIESEEISLLPPGIYRKSFIRQYAAQLGLDPDRVIATYPPLRNMP